MYNLLQFLGKFLGLFDQSGYSELYPGSSFHAVTAAFATQGYWIHANMLHFIGAGEFQRFAVLIYMFALIGGIVGMAMGSPPKMYVWFFMGPVFFHFLLGSTLPVQGTAWKVAGVPQEQKEVWKLAEVGLKSSNIVRRYGYEVNPFDPPSGTPPDDECLSQNCPEGTVPVSMAFAIFDGVVSDTIQNLIVWLGVYNMAGQQGSSTTGEVPKDGNNNPELSSAGRWHLLSNLKWNYLDTISQARLNSVELRDLFITFMSSQCGDGLQQAIDPTRYATASRSESGVVPPGVFTSASDTTSVQYATQPTKAYQILEQKLNVSIPRPIALGRLLNPPMNANGVADDKLSDGTLRGVLRNQVWKDSVKDSNGSVSTTETRLNNIIVNSSIKCSHLADIIVRGFRWEAAGVYAQLVNRLPAGVKESSILDFAFLYGWDVRNYTPEQIFGKNENGNYREMVWQDNNPKGLDANQKQQFIINLIFINMMKNEFLLAPNAAARKLRFTSAQAAQNASEMYQKTVGSRQKYSEIYSWAVMMPYLQGLVLYLLALGYPFACAVMLIPKSARILFTWASFWVWAKLWDLGFAIVVLLERSVWATIGSSQKATLLNPFIAQMASYSTTTPTLTSNSGVNVLQNLILEDKSDYPGVYASYAFLDRAMTLFTNMDLDLQNSYYIYIMAALYFAVPMMTGQLVLGAKSSLAGAITGAFQNMAQEVGARAGRALTQQMSRQAEAANQAVDQALYAKNLQAGGANSLMAQALRMQNNQAANELQGNYVRSMSEGLSNRGAMFGNVTRARSADSEMAFGFMRTMMSDPGKVAKALAITGASGAFPFNPAAEMTNAAANASQPSSAAGAGTLRGSRVTPNQSSNGGGVTVSGGAMSAGGAQGGSVPLSTGGVSNGTVSGSVSDTPANGTATTTPQNGTIKIGELFKNNFWNPMALGVEQMGRFHGYSINRMGIDTEAALLAQRSDYGVTGFSINSESQRMQREGQYLMAETKGTAQAAGWYDKASYAQQFSDAFGALEVNAPQIGAKPTDDMYMARSGLAGEFAQRESFYFNNERRDDSGQLIGGGFSSSAGGYESSLRDAFGYRPVYQEDKDGNLIKDAQGNPIPVLDKNGNQLIGSRLMDMYNNRTSNPGSEFAFGVTNMQNIIQGKVTDALKDLDKVDFINGDWDKDKNRIMQGVTLPLQFMSPARYEPVVDSKTGVPVQGPNNRPLQNPVTAPRAPNQLPPDLRPPELVKK